MKQGYCHLYFGDGKGKTSIINGMTIRAWGENLKIKYYRFMKNWPSAELVTFRKLNIQVADYYHSGNKFFWEMNDVERAKVKAEVAEGVQDLARDAKSGTYDIIFIDELFSCLDDELIDEQVIINLIKTRSSRTELVFSAHEVEQHLFKHFDLISKVQKIKHYYETIGLQARKGIEY